MYLQIFACICLYFGYKLFLSYSRFLKLKSKHASFGKNPGFFLGDIPQVMSHVQANTYREDLKQLSAKTDDGIVIQYELFGKPSFLITDPELLGKFAALNYKACSKPDNLIDAFKPLTGESLFSAPFQKWKGDRKTLNRAFSQGHCYNQLPFLQDAVGEFMEILNEKITNDDGQIDIDRKLAELALDANSVLFFGHTFNVMKEGDSNDFIKDLIFVLQEFLLCGLFVKILTKNDLFLTPSITQTKAQRMKYPIAPDTRKTLKLSKKIRGQVKEFILQAKERREKGENLNSQEKKTVLDILLDFKNEDGTEAFPIENLVDHSVTFLVAGFDTTSHTASLSIFDMLHEPEVIKKLTEELDQNVHDSMPTLEELKELKYLDYVVKESLRKNPGGQALVRKIEEDVTIDKFDFKKDDAIYCWNATMHFSEKIYENPDKFNPERWEDLQFKVCDPRFIPYGFGPRDCVGKNLANLELKFFLACLFKNYEFELVTKEIKEKMSTTLMPDRAILVNVKQREKNE